MSAHTSGKHRIDLVTAFSHLSDEAPFRRTEPALAPGRSIDKSIDRGMLEVLGDMGVDAEVSGPRAGAHIEEYELIRELGRGAMGRVFLARDTKLARRVAIKFLNAGHANERFLMEARATAACEHENIVVIHRIDEHRGQAYMVLEYLQGEPLRAMLDRPMPAHRAVEMIIPVVRAMVAAHDKGIVHRDLKPDNILVTTSGTIKVLDFGIAKLLDHQISERATATDAGLLDTAITHDGTILGTMPYMSPEQWRVESRPEARVDHRSDIWAVGMILHEMLAGHHPLEPLSRERLREVADLDIPMPPLEARVPGELRDIVAACLHKDLDQRMADARELLDRLSALVQRSRRLDEGETPYAGLSAFQEQDSHRFFGRAHDVARLVNQIERQSLVALVGATGVGKSSLVRAGVVPVLKRSGERWDVHTLRPGRNPLGSLVNFLQSLDDAELPDKPALTATHLRDEPGYLGVRLRQRARKHDTRVLVFIDQFEELYTLVADPADRQTVLSCLLGVADDPAGPLRVIISLRSDFLDRLAEDREFMELMSSGLSVLAPPERESLEMALVEPAEMAGYRFQDPDLVEDMLAQLEGSPAALPLLQFTAAKLWDARDQERRLLTRASYQSIGGVAGALASHADEVLAGLSARSHKLARAIFERLVTPERTRAIASVADLCELSDKPETARALIDRLVRARLLVANQGQAEHQMSGGPTVEIVHESLIQGWPTLRRWLDEDNDKAIFLAQLREAARQWHARGRAHGLLWRGEPMTEARFWYAKIAGETSTTERDFLDAVLWLDNRTKRRRRLVLATTLVVLVAMIVAALVALVWIRNAETVALEQMAKAELEKRRAQATQDELRVTVGELQEKSDELEQLQVEMRHKMAELDELNRTLEDRNRELEKAVRDEQEARRDEQQARHDAVETTDKLIQATREKDEALTLLLEAVRRREQELKERLKALGPMPEHLQPRDHGQKLDSRPLAGPEPSQ